MSDTTQRAPLPSIGGGSTWPAAALLGWLALGATNLVLTDALLGLPDGGLSVRLAHHAVDFGRHVGLGLLSAAALLCWQRWGRQRRGVGLGLLSLVSIALGHALLSDDLGGIAARNYEALGVPVTLLHEGLITVVALTIPAFAASSPYVDRLWRRLAVGLLAALAYALDAIVSPGSNDGAHFYLSWFVALCLTAISHGTRPAAALSRLPPKARYGGLLAGAGLATFGAIAPVSDSARIDLDRWHANLLPEASLASMLDDEDDGTRQPVDNESEPRPPTSCDILPDDGIVILLSIDGFRADTLVKKNAKHLPNIWRLATHGTLMTQAYSPGSSTVYTLAALSTGKYFSQIFWTHIGGKNQWWPIHDESPHLAALLGNAGVDTYHARGTAWMSDRFGMLRGFRKVEYAKKDWQWARGADSTTWLMKMLESPPDDRPRFLFTHFMDSHSPRKRYLHTLAYVDRQVGRIVSKVEELGLSDRTIFIVTSDHGEAFGEHHTEGHNYTLYQEVLRVPMVFYGAHVPRQRVDTMVSVIDLGPTILDLFGQRTPATFMGRSLVPFLLGERPKLDRPIAAEAVSLRGMVFEDGIKVIRNRKNGILQIYDLRKDPGERHNLSDDLTPDLEARVQRMKQFFARHALRRPGYEIPYRK